MYLLSLIHALQEFDKWMFIKLNSGLANPVFDVVMPFMRTGVNWAPLYLFLGAFVLLNFKGRGAWWILFFTATVALCDLGGNYLFKHNFGRDRPCANPEFYMYVRLLVNCVGRGNSFISNHAANHFGMASFIFITFRSFLKRWVWLAFAWAALVGFAQVYVGIHFPFDVITGALFGSLIGFLTGTLFNKRYRFAIFDNQPEA